MSFGRTSYAELSAFFPFLIVFPHNRCSFALRCQQSPLTAREAFILFYIAPYPAVYKVSTIYSTVSLVTCGIRACFPVRQRNASNISLPSSCFPADPCTYILTSYIWTVVRCGYLGNHGADDENLAFMKPSKCLNQRSQQLVANI